MWDYLTIALPHIPTTSHTWGSHASCCICPPSTNVSGSLYLQPGRHPCPLPRRRTNLAHAACAHALAAALHAGWYARFGRITARTTHLASAAWVRVFHTRAVYLVSVTRNTFTLRLRIAWTAGTAQFYAETSSLSTAHSTPPRWFAVARTERLT